MHLIALLLAWGSIHLYRKVQKHRRYVKERDRLMRERDRLMALRAAAWMHR